MKPYNLIIRAESKKPSFGSAFHHPSHSMGSFKYYYSELKEKNIFNLQILYHRMPSILCT